MCRVAMLIRIGIGCANGGDWGYVYPRWGNQDVPGFGVCFLQCVGVRLAFGGSGESKLYNLCVRVWCVNDLCIPGQGERNDVKNLMAYGADQY